MMDGDHTVEMVQLLRQIVRNTTPHRTIPEMVDQLVAIQTAMAAPPPVTVAALAIPAPRGTAIYLVQGPNGELPDPDGTPGATNPAVTPDTLAATIGTSGWTATVRPPVSYTDAVKRNVLIEYGLTGALADYELDHLVPLCCGGHPTAVENLWPQRRAGINGAALKDITEVLAQHAVLAGQITLAAAQQGFMTNWALLHAHLTSLPAVMQLMMGLAPPEPEP